MLIELTEQQLNNLKIFLLRTELRGSEVKDFMEIANILNEEKVEESESSGSQPYDI